MTYALPVQDMFVEKSNAPTKTPAIRDLSADEIDEVNGGYLPLIAFGFALYGKFAATGLVGWAFGSGGLILATYQLGEWATGD